MRGGRVGLLLVLAVWLTATRVNASGWREWVCVAWCGAALMLWRRCFDVTSAARLTFVGA